MVIEGSGCGLGDLDWLVPPGEDEALVTCFLAPMFFLLPGPRF